MTRTPQASPRPPTTGEVHAAMARVFGVHVDERDATTAESTALEPWQEEAERRAALGRVFGTEG